jgi:hypothetical protein
MAAIAITARKITSNHFHALGATRRAFCGVGFGEDVSLENISLPMATIGAQIAFDEVGCGGLGIGWFRSTSIVPTTKVGHYGDSAQDKGLVGLFFPTKPMARQWAIYRHELSTSLSFETFVMETRPIFLLTLALWLLRLSWLFHTIFLEERR